LSPLIEQACRAGERSRPAADSDFTLGASYTFGRRRRLTRSSSGAVALRDPGLVPAGVSTPRIVVVQEGSDGAIQHQHRDPSYRPPLRISTPAFQGTEGRDRGRGRP